MSQLYCDYHMIYWTIYEEETWSIKKKKTQQDLEGINSGTSSETQLLSWGLRHFCLEVINTAPQGEAYCYLSSSFAIVKPVCTQQMVNKNWLN